MSIGATQQVVRQLRRLALRETDALTDGQLLECFVSHHDEAAFAALVRRHGPMVWGVCRRVVGHAQDAEDAFQATFLVLVRKAATLRPRELVGHWLYGVAHRTALKAQAVAARRRQRERQVPIMPTAEIPPLVADDWLSLLDRELARLPEPYRVPIILCDLEGRTRRDVARQMKLPESTLSNRLTAARRMLARRLARQGVALSAATLSAALVADASAGVPGRLLVAAVRTAAKDAAPSLPVIALSEGVLKTMLLNRLKVATLVLAFVGLLGLGASILSETRADPPADADQSANRKITDLDKLQGSWLMLAIMYDGRLEPAQATAEEGKRWTFHGDKFLCTRLNTPGQVIEATFKIDPSKEPKLFDHNAANGDYAGQDIPGAYQFVDDFLIIRDDMNGKKRPKAMSWGSGSGGRIMIFGREGATSKISDDVFLRRLCLDLRGTPPTAIEMRYFKADGGARKRAKAIAWVLGGTSSGTPTYSLRATRVDWVAGADLLELETLDAARQQEKSSEKAKRGQYDDYLSALYALSEKVKSPKNAERVQLEKFLNEAQDSSSVVSRLYTLNRREHLAAEQEDADYLRRLMLDLIGTPPTNMELQYFIADTDAKKREKIIDWLAKTDGFTRRVTERLKVSSAGGPDRFGQLLDQLLKQKKTDGQILEALMLATLARFPTESEQAFIVAHVSKLPDRRAAWESVVFTLLKSTEANEHIEELNRRHLAK